ncbi:ABC transporter ATP-binding protein [Corynebacterium pelargi]|uniref:ABC-type quaternary amine transporter n=1 Tax=Corynebacterium pelargi TaxID=1471400 RepID=A0A410W5V8_9CORY|nr:ATP-binding cassette domain-containing protein [Corynebacterium pelargi]QAU51345.1 Choline transport ATP-binding protein OpuBA [Corynebacterium pelargi]GGG81586.1 ABC transporter ATP-binding protein [Corynebacterium pelargi]
MIEFQHVSKHYGQIRAVEDFNYRFAERKITVLVGSSGCGKTTLLRMINRMVTPSEGTITVRGEDIASTDPVALRRSIGYVIQSGGLLPHKTILDNAKTVPLLNKEPKQEAYRRATRALEAVGLGEELYKRYPAQLSGGQQQRVGVARALAADPDILLMDEPFGAVDPIVRDSLQTQLLQLQDRLHKTIVLVTHDIDEAFRLGDEVIVLEKGGRIAQAGTPAELLAQPANDFVAEFVGANSNQRKLRTTTLGGRTVVVDAAGKPIGVIE